MKYVKYLLGVAKVSELKDLALYLSKQLRANYVHTLLLPSSSMHILDSQFKQYDQMGIPYTAILNDKTLVDGISLLRSRDTTLKVLLYYKNFKIQYNFYYFCFRNKFMLHHLSHMWNSCSKMIRL